MKIRTIHNNPGLQNTTPAGRMQPTEDSFAVRDGFRKYF